MREVILDYTNYRGERKQYRVEPIAMCYGENDYHPGLQWLLEAKDLTRNVMRTFAMKDVHSWTPVAGAPTADKALVVTGDMPKWG
jgi:predicted DNA-binding transcriptional regulator YafY